MNYSGYEDNLPDVVCHPLYSSPCDFRQQPHWLYHSRKHLLMFSVWNYTSVACDVMKFPSLLWQCKLQTEKSQCASEGITGFVGDLFEGPGPHWHDSALFLSPIRLQTDFFGNRLHVWVLLQNAVTCSCEDCKFIIHLCFLWRRNAPIGHNIFICQKNCSTYKGTVNSYVLCECSVTLSENTVEWAQSGMFLGRDVSLNHFSGVFCVIYKWIWHHTILWAWQEKLPDLGKRNLMLHCILKTSAHLPALDGNEVRHEWQLRVRNSAQ
jgi:hypothetical protein